MAIPVLLLLLATVSAAIVGYGTHPAWAQLEHGLELIVWSRRLLWPAATLSIAMCLVLVALVVAGRRRAWWLAGLGPILALFVHRFHTDPYIAFQVLEKPALVPAASVDFVGDEDWVVGVVFNGTPIAFPYNALYCTPVVFHAEHDKRMALLWSAPANRALAFNISHELHARDLQIASMPAGAVLLYNVKVGQFISSVTGRTVKGEKPLGFGRPMITSKTTWARWRSANPSCLVMAPLATQPKITPPRLPLLPAVKLRPLYSDIPLDTRIVMLGTERPAAFRSDAVTGEIANFWADEVPILMFRLTGGTIRAFERRVQGDLVPRFKPMQDPRRRTVVLVDADSGTKWNADGRAIEGPLAEQNAKLAPLPVEDDLYWGIMKYWYPDLRLREPQGGGYRAGAR